MYWRTVALLLGLLNCSIRADDWPHWRGPRRNDTIAESSRWDEGGWQNPRERWRMSVGEGSSSPLVVASRVFTLGWANGQDHVRCLDAENGRVIWQESYRAPQYGRRSDGDKGLYSGPSATPEFDPGTGRLYTLSSDGDLHCRDAATGKVAWRRQLYDEFDVPQRPKVGRSGRRDYGFTSSPLVLGDTLIVEVGATTGCLIGFDKQTGQTRWQSQSKSPAGHTGGPMPITVQGVPCVAVHNFDGLLVSRLDAGHFGETVAEYPWKTDFANNIASPAVFADSIVLTSHYNHEKTARLRITLRGAELVWEQDVASKVCSPVIHGGHVYFAWQEAMCLDFDTGRIRWRGGRTGDPGSCIATSDGRIIVWSGRGTLSLIESAQRSPDRYRELTSRPVLSRTDAWPHVALSDGRLFCKDRSGELVCLDLVPARRSTLRVEPTEKSLDSESQATPPRDLASALKTWPGESPGLVLAWKRTLGTRLFGENGRATEWRLRPRDPARIAGNDELDLSASAWLVAGADEAVLKAFQGGDTLSLEVGLTSHVARQSGPARILSFSSDAYHRDFTLGQEGESLVFRLRTTRTGENGMQPETRLGTITAGRRHHVLIAYRPGRLAFYLDGRLAHETDAVQGDFSNWTVQHLLLGDEWNGDRRWQGTVDRFALHRRFIAADEARLRARSP